MAAARRGFAVVALLFLFAAVKTPIAGAQRVRANRAAKKARAAKRVGPRSRIKEGRRGRRFERSRTLRRRAGSHLRKSHSRKLRRQKGKESRRSSSRLRRFRRKRAESRPEKRSLHRRASRHLKTLRGELSRAKRKAKRRVSRAKRALKRRVSRAKRRVKRRVTGIRRRVSAFGERHRAGAYRKGVGDASTMGLLAEGAGKLSRAGKLARAGSAMKFLGPLAALSSIGLAAASVGQMSGSGSLVDRAEAGHGLAWAGQALLSLGIRAKESVSHLATSLGVLGGGAQTAIGFHRIIGGVRERNWSRVALGGLDLGAGVSWAVSSFSPGNPISLGAFIGFSAAKVAFTNRKAIRRWSRRLSGRSAEPQ